MALDIVEEPNGCFYVWGSMTDGGSVLVRIENFQPYLYVAMPTKKVSPLLNKTRVIELAFLMLRLQLSVEHQKSIELCLSECFNENSWLCRCLA